jgi:hypothetical protein
VFCVSFFAFLFWNKMIACAQRFLGPLLGSKYVFRFLFLNGEWDKDFIIVFLNRFFPTVMS